MGYIRRDGRSQGTLFPAVLDELVPVDHFCRVIVSMARLEPCPSTGPSSHTDSSRPSAGRRTELSYRRRTRAVMAQCFAVL